MEVEDGKRRAPFNAGVNWSFEFMEVKHQSELGCLFNCELAPASPSAVSSARAYKEAAEFSGIPLPSRSSQFFNRNSNASAHLVNAVEFHI